jgi:uncharacterized repeat protein (TIGR03806 family)
VTIPSRENHRVWPAPHGVTVPNTAGAAPVRRTRKARTLLAWNAVLLIPIGLQLACGDQDSTVVEASAHGNTGAPSIPERPRNPASSDLQPGSSGSLTNGQEPTPPDDQTAATGTGGKTGKSAAQSQTSRPPRTEDGASAPQPSGDDDVAPTTPVTDTTDDGIADPGNTPPDDGSPDDVQPPEEDPEEEPGPPEEEPGATEEQPVPPEEQPNDSEHEHGSSSDEVCADEPVIGLDARPSAAALSLPSTLEVAAPGWTTVEAFPSLTFNDATSLVEGPRTGHLFVTEREGRVYAFPNDPAATSKELVLDLSGQNQGGGDCGLQSLIFHPEFGDSESPNGAYVYVAYAYKPDPIVGFPPDATITNSRLSRFTMDLDTLVLDPASELILIDQLDEFTWHQGGAMFFDPDDGFLYLSTGDEGDYVCRFQNCQVINKDLFSGVLRIDVDMRGGDISHPIVRQPLTGTTANYFVPNDNPFVGQAGVLEEFYALGLRSPHKMTHDTIDDITWIGEVGEVRHEELDVLQRGANYQWNVLEASAPNSQPMPAEPIGIWTNPTLELPRAESTALIGGYVYRGTRLPYLYGKYIFADFVYGNVWALSYAYDGVTATPVQLEKLFKAPFHNRVNGITSFGVDENNELYVLVYGEASKIYRLDRTGGYSNAPLRLSETGVFVDTTSQALEASAGLVPYDVQTPLWSDGATKQRWVSVPDGTNVGFSEAGSWSFPQGTVFVKHFELALDESIPEERRRLETRVLVHGTNDQYFGLTYKWNEAGTDADLVVEGQKQPIDVTLAGGQTRNLQYFYPGPSDCTVCHNTDAGSVLGVRTQQLNHEMRYPETGRRANQVYTWGQVGLLDTAPDDAEVQELVSLVSINDRCAPLVERVRSYWASNCSMCHGSVIGLRANWDARFEVALEEQGVILGPSQSAGVADAFLVVPGDPENSILFRRSATTDPGFGMPPMGRSAADPDYVRVLEQWIRSLGSNEPEDVPEECIEPRPHAAWQRGQHSRGLARRERHHRLASLASEGKRNGMFFGRDADRPRTIDEEHRFLSFNHR